MPGNEIPENIHNFFEQDNSQGRQSQVGVGGWPILNNNPWVGILSQNGAPVTFNSKNYTSQPSDFEQGNDMQPVQTPFGSNSSQKAELIRRQPRSPRLNLNGYMHGSQGLQARSIPAEFQGDGVVSGGHSLIQRDFSTFETQQSNAHGYNSASARSSERPEETDAPVNFDFLGGQQLMRSQHPGISQPHPIQPLRVSDMQLWQQHLLYKQMKKMSQQQQLRQLQQGGKQQNSLSQLSNVGRQASSDQIPVVLSGMPINNASNNMWSNELVGGDTRLPSSSSMFLSGNTNWVHRSSMQGISNGTIVSHDQGQGMRTMGLVPQQPHQSLYGTPVAGTRGPVSHLSPFQGTQGSPHDFSSSQADIRVGANQTEETAIQSSAFNYFQSNQSAVPGQGYLQDGISLSKQGLNEKNLLQSASMQGVSSGATSENFQQVNHGSVSVQFQEMSEKVGEHAGPSHGAANSDPTEEKLLFSTDDDGNQDVSIGVNSDTGMGIYLHGDLMQNTDYFSSLPTIHSGSWSALMQEAVEASSSDIGLNEEWSALSFQKTELSSGNHSAMLHDNNRKQQSNWDNQNLQNASSLSSTPLPLFNDAIASSNCHATPNFQQPINLSCQRTEGLSADAFRESFQQSSKEAIKKPFDQSRQQQQLAGGSVQSQTQFSNISNGGWAERTCEQLASSTHSSEVGFHSHNMQHSWAHQQKVPLHSHSDNKLNGWNSQSSGPTGIYTSTNSYDNDDKRQHVQGNIMQRSMNMETNHDGSMWKVAGTRVPSSFPSSSARRETVGSDTHSLMMRNEDSHTANLAVINSNNLNLNHETNQQLLTKHQVDYGKHVAVDVFLQNKKEEITEKYQNQISGIPQSWDSSMHNIDRRSAELCAHKQENNHPEDDPNEGFISTSSQPGQNTEGGRIAGDSSLAAGNESQSLVNSSLKSSGQSGRRTMGPHRFKFHPMGNLETSSELIDSPSHTLYSQGPSQSAVQGLKNQERGYASHPQFAGHVLNSADTGKGHLNNLQRNGKTTEEIQYKGAFSSHSATPAFDGSTSQFPANKITGSTFSSHSATPAFYGSTSPFPANKRTGLTSQNMLELLHKVDQSRVGKAVERIGFSEQNTSGRREADSSDGPSSQLQLSQSPSFQGFGLKLAPPSQRQSASDHALPSQTSLETVNDFSQRNLDSEAKEDESRSPSSTSVQSLLPHDTIQKENQGDKSFPSGCKSKEVMYSNFHGNPLAAAAYSLRMNQSVLQQRQQQQQQQQQQQFQWRHQQEQQQHFSFASASTPNVQSEHHQVGVEAKQSSHPGKIQESHNVATPDQSFEVSVPFASGRLLPSMHTSSADAFVSAASQFSPGNTNHSQPRNASSHLRSSGQQIPVVETRPVGHPSAKSAVSEQGGFSTMLHNVWTSVSSQQRLSGVQPQKIISDVLQSQSSLPSGKESLQAPQKPDNHNKRKGENAPSEFGTCSTNLQQFTYGEDRSVKDNASQQMLPPERVDVDSKTGSAFRGPVPESDLNHHSDGNSSVAISSSVRLYQQDHNKGKYPLDSSIDVHMGQVPLPSIASSNHDTAYDQSQESLDIQKRNNYSLLQQVQAMKGAEPDPTRRAGKRLKGTEFGVNASQMDWAAGQRKVTFPSDVKMLNFSSRDNKENSSNTPLQIIGREASSQDPLTYKQHDLQNHAYQHGKTSMAPFAAGSERPQISPQMAPSWFEKYGNYKNCQTLTTYDGLDSFQRNAKASGQNYIFSKVSESMAHCIVPEQKDDASPVGCLQQSTSPTILLSNNPVPSPSHSPLEVSDNNVILIPKKRKSATLDLLPWHKEVTQGCRRLKSISMMEQEWARATNRLTEKLEEEFEMMEDGLSMARSRRRFTLTTQLMQQILPPVPRYLSADAATSYESLIYLMAKVILGDACSMISSLDSDSCHNLESGNMNSRKLNISKERDNRFSRFVEDFIGRSKKMENDFLRLDRRVSTLDVRLECQDLERHSMMNHFVKFHGRAQSEGAENSSMSETAPRRSFPQRHVTAHTLPGNLPEGVICFSL